MEFSIDKDAVIVVVAVISVLVVVEIILLLLVYCVISRNAGEVADDE